MRQHRRRFDDAGIALVALAPVRASRAWAAPESAEGRAAFDAFARTLDAASEASIATVTLHSPRRLGALHTLGYDGPVCVEHLPVVEPERKQEISTD